MIPILDACRHLLDAFPKSFDPLNTPGLILLDRPSRFCTAKRFPDWIKLMDELLPRMQFVATLTDQAASQFPPKLREKRLEIHKNEIVIRPLGAPRKGWSKKFAAMAAKGDDALLDSYVQSKWDKEEWEWK